MKHRTRALDRSGRAGSRAARMVVGLVAATLMSCDGCNEPTAPPATATITVSSAGTGAGRVTGGDIDCRLDGGSVTGVCSDDVLVPVSATLRASTVDPNVLMGWTGCFPGSDGSDCNAIVSGGVVNIVVAIERIASLMVNPPDLTMELGDPPAPLTVQAINPDGQVVVGFFNPSRGRDYVWSVDDPAVVEIETGSGSDLPSVRVIAAGATTIRVEAVGVTAAVPVTVEDPGAIDALIRGVVRDTLAGPGLEGVFVQAIHEVSGGLPPVRTDAEGEFEIPVSEAGNYSLCAIGAIPPTGGLQRFVNTNCSGEEILVSSASIIATRHLSIETGYYLGITGGPFDFMVDANDPIELTFGYRVWNRSGVPNTTTWIAVGLEVAPDTLDGQDTALGANAGPFGAPNLPAAGPGPVTVDLTAPANPGDYAIYARLLPLATAADAIEGFETGFPAAKGRNYVRIGTVTVMP